MLRGQEARRSGRPRGPWRTTRSPTGFDGAARPAQRGDGCGNVGKDHADQRGLGAQRSRRRTALPEIPLPPERQPVTRQRQDRAQIASRTSQRRVT